jgi:hypothetical protein
VKTALFWLAAMLTTLAAMACSGNDDGSGPQTQPRPTSVTSGPTATLDPARGRPGTEVVVTGNGWAPGAMITIAAAGPVRTQTQPYARATAANDGSFIARFRLDRSPDGTTLQPGRLALVATAEGASVTLAFEVTPPAPGGPVGPGG